MATWSRVFSTGRYVSQTVTCPTGCYNVTSPDQVSVAPTIYDDLDVSVSGLSGAVDYYADQLKRRLSARMTLQAPSEVQFLITLRRGNRTDQVTWTFNNRQGAYPLLVSYTSPNDGASNIRFEHVLHAIDWLVQQLA